MTLAIEIPSPTSKYLSAPSCYFPNTTIRAIYNFVAMYHALIVPKFPAE